ncbi:MAG TPA: DUF1800 domain-containing protein [Casimicrobiaceae bacterium]|nr:DUF1800 domain-containing protein [Casimicrobiaceae bacterium]
MNATAATAVTPSLRQSNAETPHRLRRARWLGAIAGGSLALLPMAGFAAAPLMDQADATRLLEQTTFGPTDALVAHVQAEGLQGWLNEQFAAPESHYPALAYAPADPTTFCATSSDPNCLRDNYSMFLVQNAFFVNALTRPDQLRQRVAFALSQIFVTSGVEVNFAYGMAQYQQMLLDNAFGNFQDLLTNVTLSSVMGNYLNMVNNDKPSGSVVPNENYGREVMQLFSIGVWELNDDGSLLLDAQGTPIPTYTQDTVANFAALFTGWTYPLPPGAKQGNHNPKNFLGNMVAVPANHDFDAKTLLEGSVDAAGKTMPSDLAFAMQNLSQHPNVGPFIGQQLIQKLVTSNPSPHYVARVSAVFDNDGTGVRGNLKAVITAILSDPEARGDVKTDPSYGKLREPVLFLTAAARALGTTSDGVFFMQQARNLGQDVFDAASVFNFYPPDYVVPGTDLLGPEFALQNASTAINRYNFANALAFGTIAPLSTLPGATGTQPNWASLQRLGGNPTALVGELNNLLLHGTMPAAMQATLLSAIAQVPAADALLRAQTAFYLTITSPEYQVER